jgi:SNF2 family DNA or RNA helicase
MEAEKFTPALKVLVLHGPDRKEHFESVPDHDIIVTTYPLISRDEKFFLDQQFDTVILDEAQYIKNAQTKLNKTICQLKADHRLSLTGTPVENHLSELWAQFNFLMPGFLGSKKEFKHSFREPIEKHQSTDSQKALARRVKPFVLRRDKNQVMTELPPKTVIVRNIELDKDQRDLYESIRISMHKKVAAAIAQKGLAKSHITVLDALLKLHQTCCDPSLLKIKAAQDIKKSAKLETLLDMLDEMIEEGRKILLFSQFTSMIKIIEERLAEKGIKYVKITGSTKDRKTPVEAFVMRQGK